MGIDVNSWLIAATALMLTLLPCLWVCVRHSILSALIAFEVASTITTLVLVLLAQGTRRDPFMDLAVVSAVLSFANTVVLLFSAP